MAITVDAENNLFKERYKMKIGRRIIQITILAQVALLMSAANAGTLSNPDVIANGQLETFSGSVEENWYTFSLNASGNVLFSGQTTDGSFNPIINIFRSDLSLVTTVALSPSRTILLEAGDYVFQVSESIRNVGGTFTLSSTQLSSGGPPIVGSEGTFNNPKVIVNGQLETFSGSVEENWYTFSLNANGNVLSSGQTTDGSFNPIINIFRSDLSLVTTAVLSPNSTILLETGDYYLQVSESIRNVGGTFTLSSSLLIPDRILPSLEYTSGFNAGKQFCTNEPTSCGIESGGGFYVIPIPVKSK